jgi:hypothetical protein
MSLDPRTGGELRHLRPQPSAERYLLFVEVETLVLEQRQLCKPSVQSSASTLCLLGMADKVIQMNDLLPDAKLQAGDLMIGCFDALLKKTVCERSHGGVSPPPVANHKNYRRDPDVPQWID